MTKTQVQLITYQLDITLTKKVKISIGNFGTFDFPVGHYVYTGSARRNMEARIARHLRHKKKLRWHIDYLLASPLASVVKVTQFSHTECEINQQTVGVILIAGFGAGDCHAGCGSHLKFIG